MTDTPASLFLQEFNKRSDTLERKNNRESRIVQEKSALLIPFRKMLKQLMDAGVYVTHHSVYEHGVRSRTYAPQALSVWETTSSPHWQPGGSIYLDHPAQIEIAISNPQHKDKEGLIVIRCATPHPQSHVLAGPFHDAEKACMALALFLSHSTVRIERPEVLETEKPNPDLSVPEPE